MSKFLLVASCLLGSKARFLFFLIVFLSIVTPVLDLIFYKLLATFFSTNMLYETDHRSGVYTVCIMVCLLVLSNLFKYVTRIRRLVYVSKIIEVLALRTDNVLGGGLNWLRMVILEYLNILVTCLQIIIISVGSVMVSLELGILLTVFVLFVFLVIVNFFNFEVYRQNKIIYNKKTTSREKGEMTVFSRVQTTERGIVVINLIFLIFFIIMLVFYLYGRLPAEEALVFVFLVRFVNSNLGVLMASILRFARGWSRINSKFSLLEVQLS